MQAILQYLFGQMSSDRQTEQQAEHAVAADNIDHVLTLLRNGGINNEKILRIALCGCLANERLEMFTEIMNEIQRQVGVKEKIKHWENKSASPLHLACKIGNIEAVKQLVQTGFDVNVRNERHETPLWVAVEAGNYSVVDLLLEIDDVDVNVGTQKDHPEQRYRSTTPLLLAAILNASNMVERICQRRPYVNITDVPGRTPLHFACHHDCVASTRALLSLRADVNVFDWTEKSPLIIACKRGQEEIVKLLLENGAHYSYSKDGDFYRTFTTGRLKNTTLSKIDQNPLVAAIKSHNSRIFKMLIEYGVCIDMPLGDRRFLLRSVCLNGTVQMVSELVSAGYDVNCCDRFDQTPLFWALRPGSFMIANKKLRYDKNHLSCTRDENLYLSTLKEGFEIIKYLIEHGAKIDQKDSSGVSLLEHCLITERILPTVLLLKYGAKLNTTIQDQIARNILEGNCHTYVQILLKLNFGLRKSFIKHLLGFSNIKMKRLLKDEINNPMSLKDQCRICIRDGIGEEPGCHFLNAVDQLPLPKVLRAFLVLGDIESLITRDFNEMEQMICY